MDEEQPDVEGQLLEMLNSRTRHSSEAGRFSHGDSLPGQHVDWMQRSWRPCGRVYGRRWMRWRKSGGSTKATTPSGRDGDTCCAAAIPS